MLYSVATTTVIEDSCEVPHCEVCLPYCEDPPTLECTSCMIYPAIDDISPNIAAAARWSSFVTRTPRHNLESINKPEPVEEYSSTLKKLAFVNLLLYCCIIVYLLWSLVAPNPVPSYPKTSFQSRCFTLFSLPGRRRCTVVCYFVVYIMICSLCFPDLRLFNKYILCENNGVIL